MMNMGWGREALEQLLRETASLPDISDLFIVKHDGTIIVHGKKEQIGKKFDLPGNLLEMLDTDQVKWDIKNDNNGGQFRDEGHDSR